MTIFLTKENAGAMEDSLEWRKQVSVFLTKEISGQKIRLTWNNIVKMASMETKGFRRTTFMK